MRDEDKKVLVDEVLQAVRQFESEHAGRDCAGCGAPCRYEVLCLARRGLEPGMSVTGWRELDEGWVEVERKGPNFTSERVRWCPKCAGAHVKL